MRFALAALLGAALAQHASAVEVRLSAPEAHIMALPAGLVLPDAILSRADAGLGVPAVGAAIQNAKDVPTALDNLRGLGVLGQGELKLEVPADLGRAVDVLEHVWYHAAPSTPRRFAVDDSWAVPAVVAQNEGVTYYVHAHFPHPSRVSLVPPQLGRVQRLVSALESKGVPLYSEQNLPKAYKYGYGKEVVDGAGLRKPVWEQSPVLSNTAKAAWTAATMGAAAALAAIHPDSPLAWALVAGAAVYNYLFWSAWVPLRRWRVLLSGDENLRRWARAVFTNRPDLDRFRRVQLPLPESAYRASAFGGRARAIAEAVSQDAKARGLSEVHILTGANHADELASELSGARAQTP